MSGKLENRSDGIVLSPIAANPTIPCPILSAWQLTQDHAGASLLPK
jgi:hypothetical protein